MPLSSLFAFPSCDHYYRKIVLLLLLYDEHASAVCDILAQYFMLQHVGYLHTSAWRIFRLSVLMCVSAMSGDQNTS